MLARPIHKCQFKKQSFASPTEIYYLYHITIPLYSSCPLQFLECPICTWFFLNWRIIALQCCVSLCWTVKWISHMPIHIPSLWDFPSPPIPPNKAMMFLTVQEFESAFPSFGPCFHRTLANRQVYWSLSKWNFLPWGFQI